MGGNVERHIGDDDRDGAAIEALQPGGNGMTHAAPIVGTPYSAGGRAFSDAIRAIDVDDVLARLPPAPDAVARLAEVITPAPQPEGEPVTLTYTNWRGETAQRTITPKRIWWGATDWHPEPQWLLTAFDAEKQADRDFAIKDFGAATPQPAARSTGGRRQMKVLIVGGPNRGQVVDVEATPSNMIELVRVLDPVRGEAFWFKVEADVKDKHSYVMRELCRAYEYLMKGETHRQHIEKNGKL